VSVRGGNTPAPDPSWSPFVVVGAPGAPLNHTFRYIQYRVELSTTDRAYTPVVREISIRGSYSSS
jgi:hypothetical protein